MQQELPEPDFVDDQRPTFLKILCILTFIGSGYGIINSAVTYFKANDISGIIVQTKNKMSDDIDKKRRTKDVESVGLMNKIIINLSVISTPQNLRKTSVGNIITSAVCLFGAILMWHLRRIGFYIYIFGTISGIIIPFYLFGSNFLTNISAGFLCFIGILFVIFYAMNLKSMK